MTKIVLISDTHTKHNQLSTTKSLRKMDQPLDLPGGDILIHAGDFMSSGYNPMEAVMFFKWFDEIDNYDTKILIAGNHDRWIQDENEEARRLISDFYPTIEYLQDENLTLYYDGYNGDEPEENVRIYGSPWQPEFHNWAFNLPRNGEKMKARWDAIPDNTDILITHGPPFGHLDIPGGNTIRVGCEMLRYRVDEIKPNEVYNLAAQSHLAVSFEMPEYTANADAVGTLRLLEACKGKNIKFYQASTSEMFGASPPPQSELTPFYPRSPYGAAKLYAHWMVTNYREAYGMYACSGILFNHESPRRGETFVTRKITQGLVKIKQYSQACLYLGNLHAKRDWGHAKDYVEAMWLMLQQDKPEDFVIATGQQHTVKDFVNAVADKLDMELMWMGSGENEHALWNGKVIVAVHPSYYRPTEVDSLCGDATKARKKLGWIPKISFKELVSEMVEAEF